MPTPLTPTITSSLWENWERATCFPAHCSCEAFHSGVILQPVSALTSLPLIAVGLWILWNERSWYSKAFGYSQLLAGIGAVFFHTSFTRIAEILDFSGVTLIAAWIAAYSLTASNKRRLMIFVTLHLIAAALLILDSQWRHPLSQTYGVLALLAALWPGHPRGRAFPLRDFSLGLGLLLPGYLLFQMDLAHTYCPENPWLQGHVWWHLMALTGTSWWFFRIFAPRLRE